MLLPLDGPAVYINISVTTTPEEVKVGTNALEERKIVTIQPLNGDVYFGYDNSVSSTTGTKIFLGQVYPIEAGPQLKVYVVSAGGSVDTRITEVS